MMRDIRYGFRALLSTPTVTFTALLTLALGIGATTAIFTVADRVLFRPLPFADPDRLVQFGTMGILEFEAYRQQTHSFESLVAYSVVSRNLHDVAEPERITAVSTEPHLFDLLGVRPIAGRTFHDTDAANVAVVSEGVWRRRFAGHALLETWTIVLDGEPYTVIGVMPATFQFPYGPVMADMWIPTELPRTTSWFQRIDVAVGRLKRDVTPQAAAAELRTIVQRLEPLAQSNAAHTVTITPLTEAVVGRSRKGILILLGAASMVLLIACANVGNLLLLRAERRKHEVAVRMALGASRGRLFRQFVIESLLLALAATVAAVFVAVAGTQLLIAFAGTQIPRALEIALDWRVFLFLLGVGLSSGIAFGMIPALHSLNRDVNETLNTRGSRTSRAGKSTVVTHGLVIAEIGLAFMLLAGAGVLLRTFIRLERVPMGIAADHVLTLRMETRGLRPEALPQGRYFRAIEERVKEIPGVREAGFVTRLHIQSPGNTGQFTTSGRVTPPNARGFPARLREASPGYFRALGIPLRAGRLFTDRDVGIVVNEALVREHFPHEDPIGRVLDRGTIIGVVSDVRQNIRLPAEPEIFSALERTSYSAATLVVSTRLPPTTLIASVRAAVHQISPNQAIYDVRTMEEVVTSSHADLNLSLRLIALFAGVALLLALAGIYGVISYAVTTRRKEFGIRLALGADSGRLLRLASRQGAVLVGAGVLIGSAGAFVLTRFLRTLLYEVTPTDPLTFVVTTLLLVGVALIAYVNPARRIMKLNPMIVLRQE